MLSTGINKRIAATAMMATFFWSGSGLYAQMGTATLSGVVTDPSGATVPKAVVVLESTERKFSRRSTTDDLGAYIFTAVPPGAYQLVASASGFREEKISDVSLS